MEWKSIIHAHWEVLEIPSGFDFVIAFTAGQIEINSDIFVQGIDVVVEPIPEGSYTR